MRQKKDYTNELDRLTCSDGGVTVTVTLKKSSNKKNEPQGFCLFTG